MRKHLIIVSIISATVAAILILLLLNYDIIPRSGSPEHNTINQLMKMMALIAMVFFAIIITFLIYALIFFRRRGETGDGRPIKGNPRLETAWTAIPLVIVIGLAVYGGLILADISRPGPPESELEVNVTAFRFGWQFTYPQYDNVQSFQLGLALDRRTVFYIQSRDVIHSFWVPDFGPKQDAVPGITTVLRLTPDKQGQFTVLCAELCGYGHTNMVAPVNVMPSGDFENWVATQSRPTATPTSTPPPASSPESSASPAPPSTQTPGATGAVINLAANNLLFDTNSITVSAGSNVTIQFNNQDNGVPHNFAAYTDSSAATPIFVGQIISGPNTITYNFTAPSTPGNYFFRCDVHPTTMTGTLVMQ